MDSSFHACFSPDGKWLVAGASLNEPLGVFEVASGREVHRFDCHAYTSAVSSDSKRLAVASYLNDKGGRETVIRLFDLTSGKEEKQFALGREGSYHSLAFSPDGKFLACGFSDDSFVLDLATGKVLYKLTGRQIWLVFSSDGKTLIASTGHRLRLWDSGTGQERNARPGEFGYNPALAVSPDGHLLASGDWMEQVVSLWETNTGRLIRRLPLKGEHRYVRNLAFSSDGQTLVACQGMGFLQFWDAATGKQRRTVQLNDPANPNKDHIYFYELRMSRDGKNVSALDRILSPIESTRLALWDTATGKPANQQIFPGELRRTAWLDDGKTAALALNDGLALVEVTTNLTRFRIPGLDVGGPVASSSIGRLVAQGQAGAVTVWESATGKQVATIPSQNRERKSRVEHLALAPDNRCIVTTDKDFLHVWDLATGKERYRWSLPEAGTDSWGKHLFSAWLCRQTEGGRSLPWQMVRL
jgi:WD40 repeat protein